MKKYLLLILVVLHIFDVNCNFTIDESKYQLNANYSLIQPFNVNLYRFWIFRNARISESKDQIILTPLQRSTSGAVWNMIPTPPTPSWKTVLQYTAYNDFMAEIADGIAFWLLQPGSLNHEPVHHKYGGPDTDFTCLMIAIDSYKSPSDHSLNRNEDEAAIIVVYNEEPRHYDWDSEGYEIMSGRCLVQNRYRISTQIISELVVEYADDELELCTTVKNLTLPSGYLIGLSASTGGHFAAYEVHSFRFYEDKNYPVPDSEPQTKLLTYLYIVSGLLIFVSLICLISVGHMLSKRLCKEESTENNKSEIQLEKIPTEMLELQRDRRNMQLDNDNESSLRHTYFKTQAYIKDYPRQFTLQEGYYELARFPISTAQSLIPPYSNAPLNTWIFRGASITPHGSIQLTEPATCDRKSVWNRIPNQAESWKLEIDKLLDRNTEQSALTVIYNKDPGIYDHVNEGADQNLGRCVVLNRYVNKTETIARLAIDYIDNKLTVYHSTGNKYLQTCVNVDIKLPLGYNFGVSAANGGIPGVYELISFKFYPNAKSVKPKIASDSNTDTWKIVYILIGVLALTFIILIVLCVILYLKNRELGEYRNDFSYYAYYQGAESGQSEPKYHKPQFKHYAVPNSVQVQSQSQATDEYDHLNFNK
uniref:CSON002030 protein n=1 Tax=Culicoides sonorensis TaxID=179676 RepID=A0A336MVU1_CULSO